MVDKDQLEKDFFTKVLIDYGYVRMGGGWEVENVDTDEQTITFKKNE